jgi:arylsulfatase A-like enzyme
VARHYGVVTDRYKLVNFYEPAFHYWELFDLQQDPHEMRSVYGRPEYAQVQTELAGELTRLRAELKVPEQDPPQTMIPAQPPKPAHKTPGK